MKLIVVLMTLILLEIFVAFIIFPLKKKMNYYALKKKFIFRFDPILGYALNHNINYQKPTLPIPKMPRRILTVDIRTNKQGFLFTEDVDKIKNKYKLIFCLGGSTTMCSECRHDKTYPAVLDSLVKKYDHRCINAGVGGFRSIHELLLFKTKILSYKPSKIIILSGFNDFEDFAYGSYEPYNQFKHCFGYGLPRNRFEEKIESSALMHVIRNISYRMKKNINKENVCTNPITLLTNAINSDCWLEEWKDNCGQIIDLCKKNNVICYFLSFVSPAYKDAGQEAKNFADVDLNMCGRFDILEKLVTRVNKTAENLCSQKGANFIDVTEDFDKFCKLENGSMEYKKRFSLFIDRVHLTEEGNSLLANFIYKKIKGDL